MRSALVVAASVAITTFGATSRPPTVQAQSSKTETRHVFVATAAAIGPLTSPGTRISLFVDVTPKPAMHVYAPEQKDVIPVSLTLDAGPFKTHAPKFPRAEQYFFKPLNETQLVYSKPFRIVQDLTVASMPAARTGTDGSIAVTGTLRYQACDDAICYMPVNVQVSWKLPRRR